jgi:hypothetical protein
MRKPPEIGGFFVSSKAAAAGESGAALLDIVGSLC